MGKTEFKRSTIWNYSTCYQLLLCVIKYSKYGNECTNIQPHSHTTRTPTFYDKIYLPLDMNVRSKFKLSHAASNLVKYSFLWSPWANFNAVKSGMVRVASTSLFLYKSNVTPAALVRNKMESHTVSTIKIYGVNCIIVAIMCLDVCTCLSIISPPLWSSSSSSKFRFFLF